MISLYPWLKAYVLGAPLCATLTACTTEARRVPDSGVAEVSLRNILYTSQEVGGTEDIRALDPATGASRVIVSGDSVSSRNFAAWSPNGRSVVFTREFGAREELYVLDSLQASPRRIGSDLPPRIFFPDWSPDGSRLLVSAGDVPEHIGVFLVDPVTGRSDVVRQDSLSYRCPSWSPEGDRFVVAAYHNGRTELTVVDTAGGMLDTLAESDSTYLDCPQWSPLGDEVLFTIFHGGGLSGWERPAFHSNLVVHSLATGSNTQITHDSGLTNYGRWASDGQSIIFQSDRHTPPIVDAGRVLEILMALEIYSIGRDGTALRRWTSNDHFDAHPSW